MRATEPAFDLLVIGEINPDLVLTGDVTPEFGQVEKMVERAALTIGSSSCIFACGAARLGLRTAFIGLTGKDTFGAFMLAEMASRGVDTGGVVVSPQFQTGLSVILSHGNDRAILTYAGAMAELRLEDIDFDLFGQARHLHIGSYYMQPRLQPHIPEIFCRAHELGLTTSLDTNYDPSERWSADIQHTLAHTDVFFPNQTELLAIAGASDLEAALAQLAQGQRIVAAKRGAEGGVAMQGTVKAVASALPVQVADTTGAGDSFDAGFLYGFLNDWDLEHSLRLACVCGSLSTRALGGTTAQPTLDEARVYLR